MPAALHVLKGPARGQYFPLSDAAVTLIGRAPSSHIVLLHRDVSGNHCLLTPKSSGRGFDLADARSRQATRVNGRAVKKVTVDMGDVISVGPFDLELTEAPSDLPPARTTRPGTSGPIRFKITPRSGGRGLFLLPGSTTVAGRNALAHLRVDDEFASEFHCLIALDPSDPTTLPFVTDLRTSNGTYINGHEIRRKQLRPGDRLTIGETQFRLAETGPSEQLAHEKRPDEAPAVPRAKQPTKVLQPVPDEAARQDAPETLGAPSATAPEADLVGTPTTEPAGEAAPDAASPDSPLALSFDEDRPQGDELLDLFSILEDAPQSAPVPAQPAAAPAAAAEAPPPPALIWQQLETSAINYSAFYGFATPPFQLAADPDYFYASPQHAGALDKLVAWLDTGPPVAALFGGRGLGKTLLLACVARRLAARQPAPVVVRPFVGSTARDHLITSAMARATELAAGFKVEGATPAERWSATVRELSQRQRPIVFLIDEAHQLPQEDRRGLVELLEGDTGAQTVRLLLVGDKSLEEYVAARELAPHLGCCLRLSPLQLNQVPAYLQHRMKAASGKDNAIFTAEALKLIADCSAGVPRDINRAAHAALSAGYCESRREIDHEIVTRVIHNTLNGAQAPTTR